MFSHFLRTRCARGTRTACSNVEEKYTASMHNPNTPAEMIRSGSPVIPVRTSNITSPTTASTASTPCTNALSASSRGESVVWICADEAMEPG